MKLGHDLADFALSAGTHGRYAVYSGIPGRPVDGPVASAFTVYQGTSNNDDASGANAMYGHAGNDWLKPGGDYIMAIGGAGDDIINDANNSPSVSGGLAYGGDGSDLLLCVYGTQTLYGDKGNDYLFSSPSQNNSLDGGAGSDRILGGGRLYGGDGNDSGTIQVPLLYNPSGAPQFATTTAGLFGQQNDDLLFGGKGRDTLSGDAGADILTGGLGKDDLSGGADGDVFRWDTIKDSPAGANKRDVVNDFDGEDRLDLALIDANTTLAGDQAFTLIGAQAFHGTAGELRYTQGSIGLLECDVNGDAVADFQIAFTGAPVIFDVQIIT